MDVKKKRKIARAKTGGAAIFDVCWDSKTTFVSVGPKDYFQWVLDTKGKKKTIKKKRGRVD